MELRLLAPATLHRQAEPYKRLLGVLLRSTCVSLSISNPYLSLAEPAGAILLRNGRVPERTLSKLMKPYGPELTGVVFGSETHPQWQQLLTARPAADTLHQVHTVLQALVPNLPAAWWDRWDPSSPPSCRILSPPDIPLAPAEALPTGVPATAGGPPTSPPRGGPVCSLGTLFLQHYLDQLGSPNTFG